MNIVNWSRGDVDDSATVQKCVRSDGRINISFRNLIDATEGQVSFAAKSGNQDAIGRWIWNSKTSESATWNVHGRLTKFVGQVVFEGTWEADSGEPWDFYLDTVYL